MVQPISIAVLRDGDVSEKSTTLDDCIYTGSPANGEAVMSHDAKYVMGSFVKMARESDGVELAAGIALVINPGQLFQNGD